MLRRLAEAAEPDDNAASAMARFSSCTCAIVIHYELEMLAGTACAIDVHLVHLLQPHWHREAGQRCTHDY